MAINFTAKQAIAIAVRYADLVNCAPQLISLQKEGGYYHIVLQAAFTEYEFYVDSFGGNVDGILTTPIADLNMDYMYGASRIA